MNNFCSRISDFFRTLKGELPFDSLSIKYTEEINKEVLKSGLRHEKDFVKEFLPLDPKETKNNKISTERLHFIIEMNSIANKIFVSSSSFKKY